MLLMVNPRQIGLPGGSSSFVRALDATVILCRCAGSKPARSPMFVLRPNERTPGPDIVGSRSTDEAIHLSSMCCTNAAAGKITQNARADFIVSKTSGCSFCCRRAAEPSAGAPWHYARMILNGPVCPETAGLNSSSQDRSCRKLSDGVVTHSP
jgi:hypothetical protein